MKFSFALFPLVVQLSPCARPAGGEHENIVEHEHEDDNNTMGRNNHWACGKDKPKNDIKGRCKQPGHGMFDLLWTHRSWGRDQHNWCRIGCCDRTAEIHDDKCKCTPYGKKYNYNHWGAHVVGSDSPEKCCGKDERGHSTILSGGRCGCTHVGQVGGWGTRPERDCCSLTHNSANVCIPGKCAKKGEKGRCCRIEGNYELPQGDPCPCFHGGARLNPNDEVGWDNCCAGHVNEAKNACGCIKDGKTSLPTGADKRDCCSGKTTADKKNCVAPTCSAVGATIAGGEHCCSNKQDKNKTCKCIPSGEEIPADATNLDCCSNIADKEGKKCGFLLKGALVPNGTQGAEVCLSGSANELGECRCVGQGKKAKNKTQCCSGTFGADGACGCLPINDALADGARQADCCTGVASMDGTCRCAGFGAPVPKGNASNCCAGADASGKFCSCHVAGSNKHPVVREISDLCCGGSYHYSYLDNECVCIPTGYAVGKWVPAKACCSSKKTDDVCSK